MNQRLDLLHPYPFAQMHELHAGIVPPAGLKPISLGVGEPQHPTPAVITDALVTNLSLLGKYPATAGTSELREAIASWISRRFYIEPPAPSAVLPVAGSREALFAFAQAILDPSDPGVVLIPNPFYQIYEGAAIMAGATPFYVPTPSTNRFIPDWSAVPPDVWPKVSLVYICSPGNPAGAIFHFDDWRKIFELADKYGFVIAADECYSEIFYDYPPMGALQAARLCNRSYERLVCFNSLSKRSSAPGLRSGFVAGDRSIIERFLQYRTYHGAAPSTLTQVASLAAWKDEAHVIESRLKYRAKLEAAKKLFPTVAMPEGGFFLWMPVKDDEEFSRRALKEAALTVLPGRYLGRDVAGENPGKGYVRLAMVAELDEFVEALERLRKIS